MKRDKVVLLGSTGSIGVQTIDVIKTVGDKDIIALACDKNIELLLKQVKQIKPKFVAIYNEEKAKEFKNKIKKLNIKINVLVGMEGILKLVELKEATMVVIALVGMVGVEPTINAIKNKKTICLANKESLVCAGDIIMPLAKKNKVEIRPIDSEHSAIWQCLQGENINNVNKIYITASGGPFYGKTKNQLKNVKVSDALKHPNWSMGKKITIDSATLVNKGLEVIEAHHLFNIPYEKIEVIVQRESIIHSMVEFNDGSVKAQLGVPSMRVPIEFALYKTNRKFINEKTIDWKKLSKISIDIPDVNTFKGLKLAYDVGKIGGLMPAVFNALNEVAVYRFLNNEIKFLEIYDFIENGIKKFKNKNKFTKKDVVKTIEFARSL